MNLLYKSGTSVMEQRLRAYPEWKAREALALARLERIEKGIDLRPDGNRRAGMADAVADLRDALYEARSELAVLDAALMALEGDPYRWIAEELAKNTPLSLAALAEKHSVGERTVARHKARLLRALERIARDFGC